ncbi:hypothetical protein AGMMS49992_30800 [Clostridia bacterium]|nr:hypothetical protein AGMMS49992_30800 [Clostridia bacterium]
MKTTLQYRVLSFIAGLCAFALCIATPPARAEANAYANLLNGGWVAEVGSYIVYADITTGKGIYIMDADGSNRQLLCAVRNPQYLNVVGDNLYFVSYGQYSLVYNAGTIYRYNASSNALTKLREDNNIDFMKVDAEAGYIYFNSGFDTYRINLDGTGYIDTDAKLDRETQVNTDGRYIVENQSGYRLYANSGSLNTGEWYGSYHPYQLYEYVFDSKYIYNSAIEWYTPGSYHISYLSWSEAGNDISSTVLYSPSKAAYNLQLANGWLFYSDYRIGDLFSQRMYMMRTDGTDRQIIEPIN